MTTSAIINDLLPALTDVTCYMRLTWGIYPLIMDACMHVHLEGGSYLHVASNGGFYVCWKGEILNNVSRFCPVKMRTFGQTSFQGSSFMKRILLCDLRRPRLCSNFVYL
ncbi:hypothetical protein VIGAN_04328900 [Vigna angularis var. angularis]|uniref:Uncharacterized protein n=1 Tax=Vigna angularis var. angularis TaxID=157739 RepID=A0A0S3RYR1_PHAAN|nr:hypothetical protein VIGAN_04328900 [Vigna angularis var. angularis]